MRLLFTDLPKNKELTDILADVPTIKSTRVKGAAQLPGRSETIPIYIMPHPVRDPIAQGEEFGEMLLKGMTPQKRRKLEANKKEFFDRLESERLAELKQTEMELNRLDQEYIQRILNAPPDKRPSNLYNITLVMKFPGDGLDTKPIAQNFDINDFSVVTDISNKKWSFCSGIPCNVSQNSVSIYPGHCRQ